MFNIHHPFYEDSMYIYYVQSILNDGDFNLINQVPENFRWLVTKEMFFPSIHSEIQTPFILIFYLLEKMVTGFFSLNILKEFHLAAYSLNVFSLLVGYHYTKMAIKKFNFEFTKTHFFVFLMTSCLLYFSTFYLTVIEIFSFSLSSFCFYNIALIHSGEGKKISPFIVGLISTLLLMSKISYIFIFLAFLGYFGIELLKNKRKSFCFFLMGSLLGAFPFVLNNYIQYGRLIHAYSYFSVIMDYSFENIFRTLRVGYFGYRGLFFTNPLFLPSFFFLCMKLFKYCKGSKSHFYLYFFLICWLLSSFFQTIFIMGPIVDDHYVGRLTLTALPLLLFGFSIISKKIKIRYLNLFLVINLVLWQLLIMMKFQLLHENGHYSYVYNENFVSIQDVFNFISVSAGDFIIVFTDNIGVGILLFLLSLLLTYFNFKDKFKEKMFIRVVFLGVLSLILFSFLNYINHDENNKSHFASKEILKNVVIADGGHAYVFNYLMDGMRSHYLNSDKHLKKKIEKRFRIYYKKVKEELLRVTPEFQNTLDSYDFNYTYFKDD